jgi:protein TonB
MPAPPAPVPPQPRAQVPSAASPGAGLPTVPPAATGSSTHALPEAAATGAPAGPPAGTSTGAATSPLTGLAAGSVAGPASTAKLELPSSSANYLNNPKPVYPRRSERLGEQGVVLLSVVVAADGRVREASVKSSSGFERLDQAAREAVLAWTFVPGRRNGLAVEMSVDVPIRFQPAP